MSCLGFLLLPVTFRCHLSSAVFLPLLATPVLQYNSLHHVLNIKKENKDYCCWYRWSHFNDLRVWKVTVLVLLWYEVISRHWAHRSSVIRCYNDWLVKLNTGILQWCKCCKVQSRMTLIGFLSVTSALEPVYNWASIFLICSHPWLELLSVWWARRWSQETHPWVCQEWIPVLLHLGFCRIPSILQYHPDR